MDSTPILSVMWHVIQSYGFVLENLQVSFSKRDNVVLQQQMFIKLLLKVQSRPQSLLLCGSGTKETRLVGERCHGFFVSLAPLSLVSS